MAKFTIPPTKVCSKCKIEKSRNQFWKDRCRKDGLMDCCAECGKIKNRNHTLRRSFNPKSQITKKQCSKCQKIKNVSEYWSNRTTPTGLCNMCKPCLTAYNNTPHTREHRRILRRESYRRVGYRTHKNQRLRKKYGITLTEYESMLATQKGLCAICKEPDKYQPLGVDHNHKTGKARALLCAHCNMALGGFRENVNFLKAAIKYLKRHS